MDIEQNKQSREALKGYFVPNAIPTAAQFALLIDSVLNQRSDGLVKPAAGPLSIEATGPGTGLRPVLDFYENMSNAQPSFSLALRPGANNTRQALTVLGEANTALLSIDRTSGNIGIGTADPKAKLEVNGSAVISGNVGVGTQTPRAKLEVVGGAIMPAEGNTTTAGIAFPPGRTGDQAYIRWYTRSDEDTTLEIGNSNDAGDHISLMPSGNVGIGTLTPRAKLEVNGAVRVGDLAMGPWPSNQGYVFLGSATQNQEAQENYGLLFGTSNDVGSTILNGSTQVAFRIRNADQMRLTSNGNFGIGTSTPRAKLEVVGGAIMPAAGDGEAAGILFPPDAFGASGDRAWIRWLRRGNSDEHTTLEIGVADNAADHIALMPSGNVGIGTREPRAKLEVVGAARVGDLAMGPWPANSGNYVFLGSALMDQAQSGNYGLLIGTNAEQGSTYLNAASVVGIRIGNQQRLVLDRNTLTVTARLVALDQEDWKVPSLLNGWKDFGREYSDAHYMKDSLGFVRLRGLVKDGAGVIFKLPVGYTPSFKYLHCISNSGESGGRIDVTVDGDVIHVKGSNVWVSLDGITFRAETPPTVRPINLVDPFVARVIR